MSIELPNHVRDQVRKAEDLIARETKKRRGRAVAVRAVVQEERVQRKYAAALKANPFRDAAWWADWWEAAYR